MRHHVAGWGRLNVGAFMAPRPAPAQPPLAVTACAGCGKTIEQYASTTRTTLGPCDTMTGRVGAVRYWCERCGEKSTTPSGAAI